MIDGVVGVILWTEDVERLAAFYRDVLELTPHSRRPDFVAFSLGDVRLSIGRHDSVRGRASDPFRIMINLGVTDIHGLSQRLRDKGASILRPPEQEHWGGWVATFRDPDGNILQLLQQPP